MVDTITVRASYRQFVTDLAGLNCYTRMGGLWSQRSPYKPTMALFAVDGSRSFERGAGSYVRHDDAAGCEEVTRVVSLLVHVGDGGV
jgi:hypothetical protein